MRTYPINLVRLEQKRCVVIGGGSLALRKITGLVAAGARPTVISPELNDELQRFLAQGKIVHRARSYASNDVIGAFLVIAATGDPDLNRQIWEDAKRQGALVNVVDQAEICDYYTPAVLRRGDWIVSLSSGGAAPALAVHARQDLERYYGEEYGLLLEWCAVLRPAVRHAYPNAEARRAAWSRLFESPVLEMIAQEQFSQALDWVRQTLGEKVASSLFQRPEVESA